MQLQTRNCYLSITLLMYAFVPLHANTTRFSQLVFSFGSPREYEFSYNQEKNALTLEIKNTSSNELSSIEHYDETLIRRILVKDVGHLAVELTLVLRDRNVRVAISDFKEPFRINVDLFDKNYNPKRDPKTGLPLSKNTGAQAQSSGDFGTYQPTNREMTTSAPHDPAVPKDGKRLLMQPKSKLLHSPGELRTTLAKIDPGVGRYWKNFPIYIFRVQIAPYQTQADKDWYKKNANRAMSSAEAMADYAGKLFDFGHENRALVAYQQVLHKDPGIFDKNAVHLWRLAEIHFGQANLTLADGYYDALINKHREHPLSSFARLRRLDIEAVRASAELDVAKFSSLSATVAKMGNYKDPEIKTQATIRKAYWNHYAQTKNTSDINAKNLLVSVNTSERNTFNENVGRVESQRTAFLASSLLIKDIIKPKNAWTSAHGVFAAKFFKRFKGKASEPFRSQLRDELKEKLNATVQGLVDSKKYLQAIRVYEDLPPLLQSINKSSRTAWALAESYRRIGQTDKAIKFYETAAYGSESAADRFRAMFWFAVTAGATRQELLARSTNPARASLLGQKTRKADRDMQALWSEIDSKKQNDIIAALRIPFEQTLDEATLLKTPTLILLQTYESRLSKPASGANANDATNNFSPSAATVFLLSKLAKRFSQLSMNKERRKAINLLKEIKPSQMADSKSAKQLWAKELLGLAGEYRENNQYLEAGRLYSFAGSEGEDISQRAEALYKGGLLLYRAGRRDEATESFRKCSEDGDNRYYANQCLLRLEQLNN